MKFIPILVLLAHFPSLAQFDTTSFVEFPDVEAKFPGGAAKMPKWIPAQIDGANVTTKGAISMHIHLH